MKFFTKCLAIISVLGCHLCIQSVAANDEMEKLLGNVKSQLATQLQQENQRLTQFKQQKSDKDALLAALEEELVAAKTTQESLTATYNEHELQRVALEKQLQERSQQLDQVFVMTRKYGADLLKDSDNKWLQVRYPNIEQTLAFINQDTVPTVSDIKSFWFMQFQVLAANSGIQQYEAPVVQNDGLTKTANVYQLSSFAVLDKQGHYLQLSDNKTALQTLAKQPNNLTEQALAFFSGESRRLTIDPQKGELLIQSTLKPTFEQRLHQGGIVGYIILGLGALGLLISVWRLLYMNWVSFKVKRQIKRVTALPSNPLGRVLLAAKEVKEVESAELLIDKALLQEVPRLERCHSLVKLLAAIAPLLGLLGTVTGMIETFQSITLLGASDPKLMAGGISQALVTTVMGLCVAIPLLFCHSFITGKSKLLLQLIQQQGLLLLSDYYTAANKGADESTCLVTDQLKFEGKAEQHERSTLA